MSDNPPVREERIQRLEDAQNDTAGNLREALVKITYTVEAVDKTQELLERRTNEMSSLLTGLDKKMEETDRRNMEEFAAIDQIVGSQETRLSIIEDREEKRLKLSEGIRNRLLFPALMLLAGLAVGTFWEWLLH